MRQNRVRHRLKRSNRFKNGPLGLSPRETADRLSSSKSTVYRLLAAKKLRAIKRGASTLILPDSIDEYESTLVPFESHAAAAMKDAAA